MSSPVSLATSTTTRVQTRPSTQQQTKQTSQNNSPYKKQRVVLSPKKAGSIIREETHDCDQVDKDSSVLKVWARFELSFSRFTQSYAFECTTLRGRTHYNASQAHCGKCEAGHGALSPTIYDDMLDLIKEEVRDNPFTTLDKIHQLYLEKRFALTQADRDVLSNLDSDTRLSHFEQIISRLTPKELKSTFAEGNREYNRNMTFENPRASNRVDCHLEYRLRDLEDQLAEKCKGNFSPTQALHELKKEYEKNLLEMKSNLEADQKTLNRLEQSIKDLAKSQTNLSTLKAGDDAHKKAFSELIDLAQTYYDTYEERFGKKYGIPEFLDLKKKLDNTLSPYVTRTLLTTYKKANQDAIDFYEDNLIHFTSPGDRLDKTFEECQLELKKRLAEIEIQLEVVLKSPDYIDSLLKLQFGIKDSSGVLRTPKKEQVAENLLNQVKPVTPTRSDLHKPKTPSAKLAKKLDFLKMS